MGNPAPALSPPPGPVLASVVSRRRKSPWRTATLARMPMLVALVPSAVSVAMMSSANLPLASSSVVAALYSFFRANGISATLIAGTALPVDGHPPPQAPDRAVLQKNLTLPARSGRRRPRSRCPQSREAVRRECAGRSPARCTRERISAALEDGRVRGVRPGRTRRIGRTRECRRRTGRP